MRGNSKEFEVRFFIGKGGVGKTTISSAYALMKAREGYRVFIVSLDPAHNLGDVLGLELSEEPVEVTDNLVAAEIDFDKMVREYMKDLAEKIKDMYGYLKIFNLEGYVDILRYSPGIEEHATLEKIKEIIFNNMSKKKYDVIVFDTPPTGLTVRMLALPSVTLVWLDKLIELRLAILGRRKMIERVLGEKPRTRIGDEEIVVVSEPMEDPVYKELMSIKKETKLINEVLTDKNRTTVSIIINPEVLSVLEAERATKVLKRLGINIKELYINKIMKIESPPPELKEKIKEQKEAMRVAEQKFSGMKITEIPYLPWEPVGLRKLEQVCKYLRGV